MSGAPIYKKNLELVKYIHEKTEGRLPIIGVGGIMSPEQAKEMLDAGLIPDRNLHRIHI